MKGSGDQESGVASLISRGLACKCVGSATRGF
ncbi:hypothetical protein [Pseudomonas graminis]